MEDKELLELAAKGAGYSVRYVSDGKGGGCFYMEPSQLFWNPLTEDGDALRLAVLMAKYGAFHIDIYHSQTSCRVTPKDTTENEVYGVCWNDKAHEGCADIFDQNAATRRAIVRAASASASAPNLNSSVRPVDLIVRSYGQLEKTMENEKPKCTTRGFLRGGRAMCGYVIVGGELCSLKPGECNMQEGAKPEAANGVLADLMEDDVGSRAGTCDY